MLSGNLKQRKSSNLSVQYVQLRTSYTIKYPLLVYSLSKSLVHSYLYFSIGKMTPGPTISPREGYLSVAGPLPDRCILTQLEQLDPYVWYSNELMQWTKIVIMYSYLLSFLFWFPRPWRRHPFLGLQFPIARPSSSTSTCWRAFKTTVSLFLSSTISSVLSHSL